LEKLLFRILRGAEFSAFAEFSSKGKESSMGKMGVSLTSRDTSLPFVKEESDAESPRRFSQETSGDRNQRHLFLSSHPYHKHNDRELQINTFQGPGHGGLEWAGHYPRTPQEIALIGGRIIGWVVGTRSTRLPLNREASSTIPHMRRNAWSQE
jgi:hypothetical protein